MGKYERVFILFAVNHRDVVDRPQAKVGCRGGLGQGGRAALGCVHAAGFPFGQDIGANLFALAVAPSDAVALRDLVARLRDLAPGFPD